MNKKHLLLTIIKLLGAFWVARRLTAHSLRILCYHGISVEDEHEFRGRLFMQEQTFLKRMHLLQQLGHPVLPLDRALQQLRDGTLPPAAVVITFDDGWEPACMCALHWLVDQGIPATLYVSSYYVDKDTQVFNVAVQYLFWKSTVAQFDPPKLGDLSPYDLADPVQRRQALEAVLSEGKKLTTAGERQSLLEEVADALGVDIRAQGRKGAFRFASRDTILELSRLGIDIQLHTHRHNLFDGSDKSIMQEIEDNRRALEYLGNSPRRHFCYPGGLYSPKMWPTLDRLDIESATTCETGFNYQDTPHLGLKRILDEECLTMLEFEAELSGVFELRRLAWEWFGFH